MKNQKASLAGNTKIFNWKRLLPTTSDNLFQVHILKIKANLEYKPVWPELELFQNQSWTFWKADPRIPKPSCFKHLNGQCQLLQHCTKTNHSSTTKATRISHPDYGLSANHNWLQSNRWRCHPQIPHLTTTGKTLRCINGSKVPAPGLHYFI